MFAIILYLIYTCLVKEFGQFLFKKCGIQAVAQSDAGEAKKERRAGMTGTIIKSLIVRLPAEWSLWIHLSVYAVLSCSLQERSYRFFPKSKPPI